MELSELMDGKSAVLISHRLSSLTLADRIIFLADGRILEELTHEELMDQKGEYAKLFNLQDSRYASS
ncbi:MAG: hypothetical protein GX288_01110 [Clostridiales bacterium]|nr:hypothetical protein [Clostridiales bacterium]